MSENRVPPRKSVNGLWIVVSIVALSIAGSIVTIGLKKRGLLSMSNVGELPELAFVQDALRPLDACELRYASRDKRGRRQQLDVVFGRSCDNRSHVVINVPPGWGHKSVGFLLERGSASAAWEVLVEKDDVPFPDLVGALREMVPIISAEYATKKAEYDRDMAHYDDETRKRKADEEARKDGAKSSYPSAN